MRMVDLRELAKNPDFISGIHNYCDRWCERCPFTARCLLYATEQADADNDPASRDINNEAFWKKLGAIFQETKQMISDWAKENGVDLSPEALAEVGQENYTNRESAKLHPVVRAAEEYAFAVNGWFAKEASQPPMFSDDTPQADDSIGPDEDANEFIDIIRWYQFFVAVKLTRGFLSRADEDEYEADERALDSDGSVKAALIGIDRSLAAWKVMRELKQQEDDSIDKFLLDLEKLRVSSEAEFPRARDFIRPGFDESLEVLH